MNNKIFLTSFLLTILPIASFCTSAYAQSGSKMKGDSTSMQSTGQSSQRIVMVKSSQSFDDTYKTLKTAIESKDLKVIAEIDHAKNAKSADMDLPPTKVIIFGNPKVGTPLMKADQSMALDLPQRMAVYEDAQGDVHLIYNDPQVIANDHQLTGQDMIIGKVSKVLKMLSGAAASGGNK